MQDIEDRYLLLMSSMSFVDLPFQEHRMIEKHHMNQNPYISSIEYSGTRCGDYYLVLRRLTILIGRKILDSAVDEVS
jgi:hypothetical protein